jgi:hypothetical protein
MEEGEANKLLLRLQEEIVLLIPNIGFYQNYSQQAVNPCQQNQDKVKPVFPEIVFSVNFYPDSNYQ